MQVVIGIPAQTQPPLLERTLAGLRATAAEACVVVIPCTPDAEMTAYLASLEGHQEVLDGSAEGGAACFNRLTACRDADVYVLLESGAVAAQGWLERLLGTFRRVPGCGLTGPSTNRSWNEQAAARGAELAEFDTVARSVARRFGVAYRSLEPLHSLADFCYAVRREVVEAIGLADESYGTGPCWEMDFNIRAHRAGFAALWTCGAYVHRAHDRPCDAAMLERSKQYYQDKFCGLRLRGVKTDYKSHCRGGACVNFAPAGLIEVRLEGQAATVREAIPHQEVVAVPSSADLPLVSCIMPTCDRRPFLPAAIQCFLAQKYPRLELVVVDDGADRVEDLMPVDARVRYVRLERKLTIGAKRNVACEHARGGLIVHWDDDDWHAADRVERQVSAMLKGAAQVGGTTTLYYRRHDGSQSFCYAYGGPGSAWMGAMIYTREAWQRHRFENLQVGEDVRFIARIAAAARLDMHDRSLTIGTVHAGNTSPKPTSGAFWRTVPMEVVEAVMQGAAGVSDAPLVSCMMPTHNRRVFIALALEGFLGQTYANKELVAIDDGSDAVADLLEGVPGVRYVRVAQRMTIGAKRNLACEVAKGELMAHWDDDDWYGPGRLAYQAAPLLQGRCELNGLAGARVLEMPGGVFWSLSRQLHQRMFVGDVHGGTLMFPKSLMKDGVRYPEANLAEDAALLRQVTRRRKRLLRMEDDGQFVYLRHGRNTWQFEAGRFVDAGGWQRTGAPEGFAAATLESYRTACALAT